MGVRVYLDTSNYVVQSIEQCRTLPPPEVPTEQSFPSQESGTRLSRALPYQFSASDTSITVDADQLMINMEFEINNIGTAGAPFMLLDNINLANVSPRQYTVEGGKKVTDLLTLPLVESKTANYHLTFVGPNGFARELIGDAADVACIGVRSSLSYQTADSQVGIDVCNTGSEDVEVVIKDNAYGTGGPYVATVVSGDTFLKSISTITSGNWYDLTVSVSGNNGSCLTRRYMGRMETGVDTISDPAMANGTPGLSGNKFTHPDVPEKYRVVKRNFLHTANGKDSVFYDDPKKDEL